ncbi:hypothetical protein [uncultured Microbacterium sp.]|uniref:hypothetical protein n=1 Tax=uncultured Microbacterium sp. TaxID=191216 RepID=UPI0025FDD4FF|nr:hypothetical protein [uncultured Microbacterium sp.]
MATGIAVTDVPSAEAAVTSSAQADARAMLNSGRLTFGHPEPRAQIEAYASGVERVNPNTGRPCNINKVLLGALKRVVVDRGISIQMTSLNRWCEGIEGGPYSFHSLRGGGHAVDVGSVNGVLSTGAKATDLTYIRAMAAELPAPAGLGQLNCGQNVSLPGGWVRFDDGCNHVHIEYRGDDVAGSSPPAQPSTTDRSFSITTGGTLQGKTSLYAPVVNLRSDIVAVDADLNTVAAVDSSGTVWVQTGGFDAPWVGLASGAKDVAVDGQRFVVLHKDGTVTAKDGLYSTEWTTQLGGATQIDAADGRIGVVADGTLFVKDGNLWSAWTNQLSGVTDFSLDGNRIGVVAGGVGYVKEGTLWDGWVTMAGASRIEVAGNRVGIISGGTLQVKEGNLWQPWVAQSSADDFALAPDRIALRAGQSIHLKNGNLYESWIGAYSTSRDVELN